MMPIPTHLSECVVPSSLEIPGNQFVGTVQCVCGSQSFIAMFPDQLNEESQLLPSSVEVDGHYIFLIKARCNCCKKEYLLFDRDYHGWDGFVCHDPREASIQRPPLNQWKCSMCGSVVHNVTINIHSLGKEDFLMETNGKFDESRWFDGFDWISISLKCCNCGLNTKDWVDYETA